MAWVLTVVAAWMLLGLTLALLLGRAIAEADRQAGEIGADAPNFVVDRPTITLGPY